MAEQTKTGGPAFPRQPGGDTGMTLRDYFAAKAMQALVSNDVLQEIWRDWTNGNELENEDSVVHAYATVAYGIADAMLKAREVKNES